MAHCLGRRRTAVDVEQVAMTAVRMEVRRQDATVLRIAGTLRRSQNDRAGAVAEQDAGAAVIPVENARAGFGADDQRRASLPGTAEIVSHRQRIAEDGAPLLHRTGGPRVTAQARLH